jgi:type III restriction-modification system styLTI enzyme mod (EC 2.1.1.72)
MQAQDIFDNKNITANSKQLAILKQNFPQCFDKSGKFDIETLSQILGVENIKKEGFELKFLGKSYARLTANLNPKTLLMPDIDHNSKNENAQNLLIKGDNLEVLKHLKNAYFESIKMIYIDPPYNTGSDGFVYKDDRKFSIEELSSLASISQEEAKRVLEFTAKGSNSHSAWLSFIYPRLYIARELLRDDGVIFISIDDNEQAQLKILCDEIFGEENFVANLTWNSVSSVLKQSKLIRKEHEFILTYSKNKEKLAFNRLENNMKFSNPDNDPNGPWFSSNAASPDQKSKINFFGIELPNGKICERNWKFTYEDFISGHISLYLKGSNVPRLKIYERDYDKNTSVQSSILTDFGSITTAKSEIKNLFNQDVFDTPKPIKLLQRFIHIATNQNDIILDFFAGSGTTAHAVMAQNLEDGGNRKFILVQLDEKIDERSSKVAYDFCKNELKSKNPTIFDITKERILRAEQSLSEDDARLKFKIFSTVPLLKSYLDKYLDGDSDTKELNLFPKNELSKDDLTALLTTFTAYDGIKLTDELKRVDLGVYEAYYSQKKLYLINENFNSKNLKALVEKIDSDKEFAPEKIVIYEPSFESSRWREIDEAIKNYANKKNLQISLIIRH